MAAPAERYAQVSETLVNHPKTTRVCRSLRIHRLMFVGHMTCLWNWAMKNAPDGNLSRYSARDISDAAMFTDPDNFDAEEDERADQFVRALVECHANEQSSGFLEYCGESLCIHDWDQYRKRRKLGRIVPTGWARIRLAVFTRDGFRCQYCGAAKVPLQCDHIFPVSRGGDYDLNNLITACKPCNSSKSAKTPEEWRK